ncbi:MAG: metallophosphoesterase [Polyangiales bacterium]
MSAATRSAGALAASLLAYVAILIWLRRRVPSTKRRPWNVVGPLGMATLLCSPVAVQWASKRGFPREIMIIYGVATLLNVAMVGASPFLWLWELVCALLFRWARDRRDPPQKVSLPIGDSHHSAPLPVVAPTAFALRSTPSIPPTLGASAKTPLTRREALATVGGGAILVGSVGTLVFGVVRTRIDIEVVELPIRIARLPRALDGFSIVQVSDVHVGPFFGEHDLRRAEDLVRGLRPDLVALTGDLVHMHLGYLPLAVSWVSRLAQLSRHGVAAVPGNHEYYAGCAAVLNALRSAGVDVLLNRGRLLAKDDGGGFGLVGVDDLSAPRFGSGVGPRVDSSLASLPIDVARVLLCHQPGWHDHAASYGFDLMLSGHLHGGQIAPVGPLVAGALFGPVKGLHLREGCLLYVNRGLGTSGPPSRSAIRPEITKIVLVAS